MQTGYKVLDIMTNKPVTATRDMTLKDAAALMAKEDVNSILLVENEQPVGIVTDEDIVRKCVAVGLDSKKLKLKDIATTNLITIHPEEDVYEALSLMREHNIRQLPVVDNKLVGFLTIKGILKIQPDLIDLWIEKYNVREEPRRLQEMEQMAEDDGSDGFFSKLKLRSGIFGNKNNSKKKR
ncbi:MAG: cyclic nucleotide-binding/CBS domain-containing protein [Candidatus Woesearchaeota archaeon]